MAAVLALAAPAARAEPPEGRTGFCATPMTRSALLASDASLDLYNAVLWTAGTGALTFGATAKRRWSRTNDFDEGIRDGLRANSVSSRRTAILTSDALLGLTAGLLPLAGIGRTLFERDCEQAWDMMTDALESVALTLFVTRAVKVASGRERPYGLTCAGTPPRDSRCGADDRFEGFFSGHSSLAAAGAGVSCAFAIRRRTWGEGTAARALPCAIGLGAAIATGTLRIVSDRHWGSDVIVGLGVGAAIGYLDTWGPFDLLRFERETHGGASRVRGALLPHAGPGGIGARLALTF